MNFEKTQLGPHPWVGSDTEGPLSITGPSVPNSASVSTSAVWFRPAERPCRLKISVLGIEIFLENFLWLEIVVKIKNKKYHYFLKCLSPVPFA